MSSCRVPLAPSRYRIAVGIVIWVLLQPSWGVAQSHEGMLHNALTSLSTERMLTDIRTLSAPTFNGRQSGTTADLESAQWVAQQVLSAGLSLPHIHNDSLPAPIPSGKGNTSAGMMATLIPTPTISPDPILRIGTAESLSAKQAGTDYFPIFDSPSADIQAPVVFVGYGIVDPTQGIDDYAGVDVNNCIVLFLRGKPDHYKRPISHADKVHIAQTHGAIGYLTATGPVLNSYEARRGVTGTPSAFYGQIPLDQAIPGVWVSTALAESLLADEEQQTSHRLRLLQERLNHASASQSIKTPYVASLHWNTLTQDGVLVNVVGMLPGTGTETIIIGAHRDHFGRPAGVLFPGADDNASGTAVILEVARALAKVEAQPQRTILFLSFSGEERDLLGSRLYTSRPVVPLNATKAMINIDHAGVGNGRLTIGVTGMEKEVPAEASKAAGVQEKSEFYGFFPGGDHVPFKEAGVPTVTVVSSGIHPHFHQPSDTADTIDPDVLATVARYALSLTWKLAYEP